MITSIVGRLIKKPEVAERIQIPGKHVLNFTVVENRNRGERRLSVFYNLSLIVGTDAQYDLAMRFEKGTVLLFSAPRVTYVRQTDKSDHEQTINIYADVENFKIIAGADAAFAGGYEASAPEDPEEEAAPAPPRRAAPPAAAAPAARPVQAAPPPPRPRPAPVAARKTATKQRTRSRTSHPRRVAPPRARPRPDPPPRHRNPRNVVRRQPKPPRLRPHGRNRPRAGPRLLRPRPTMNCRTWMTRSPIASCRRPLPGALRSIPFYSPPPALS